MEEAARHIDSLVMRLVGLGAEQIALSGGLASALAPWLGEESRRHLVQPAGDALSGALQLAHEEAMALAAET
jgi:glucosamine kinase